MKRQGIQCGAATPPKRTAGAAHADVATAARRDSVSGCVRSHVTAVRVPSTFAALAVAMVAVAVAGCRDHARLDAPSAALLNDAAHRHPIAFSARSEALYVEVPRERDGLSGNQEVDVARFLARYKSEAQGPLSVALPLSARGHMAASRSVREIEDLVERAGIPRDAIRHDRSRHRDPTGPSVKLSFVRAVAMPPVCGDWPDDLGRVGRERLPHDGFGCATQRNLALTVANARDLQVPQDETPRSSERRAQTWSKYLGSLAPSGGAAASPAPSSSGASGSSK
ncbi:MAG: CpaD family pilus assembly lipoprotein [Hyphomicrobiaceae bacterium]|nr:CpaD family pilus assembly lipoprotein [Hyphomicrobiaceae bacterium]